jgi:hypothetical protein
VYTVNISQTRQVNARCSKTCSDVERRTGQDLNLIRFTMKSVECIFEAIRRGESVHANINEPVLNKKGPVSCCRFQGCQIYVDLRGIGGQDAYGRETHEGVQAGICSARHAVRCHLTFRCRLWAICIRAAQMFVGGLHAQAMSAAGCDE